MSMMTWPKRDPEGELLARELPFMAYDIGRVLTLFRYRQKSFKAWRADGHENLWTRGSRTRTCGRFFCCTIMITAFLIISIILSLALVRPRLSGRVLFPAI